MYPLRRPVALCALLLFMPMVAAAPAVASETPTKVFSVDLGPDDTLASGKSVAYTAKVTNTLSNQNLGAVNLTAPEGVVVRSSSHGSISGRTVQLRNLVLPPAASLTVQLQLDTSAVGGTLNFTAAGKQANNFNGTGNDFFLDPTSDLTVEVQNHTEKFCDEENVGSTQTPCTLTVTWTGTGPINSDGTPVPNDGLDAPEPPSTSRAAAASASASAEPSATTTSFSVTVTVSAYPVLSGNSGVLSLRMPASEVNCLNNSETSPVTALINGPLGRTKTVFHNVDAGVALAGPSQGMCYAAPTPFGGTPLTPIVYDGQAWFQGTLPDCFDNTPQARLRGVHPCTSFRGNEGGNNVTSTEIPASTTDPAYRP